MNTQSMGICRHGREGEGERKKGRMGIHIARIPLPSFYFLLQFIPSAPSRIQNGHRKYVIILMPDRSNEGQGVKCVGGYLIAAFCLYYSSYGHIICLEVLNCDI